MLRWTVTIVAFASVLAQPLPVALTSPSPAPKPRVAFLAPLFSSRAIMHHAVLALLWAAQTTIYSETFDAGAPGWTFAPPYGLPWAAEAPPALAGTTPTHVS